MNISDNKNIMKKDNILSDIKKFVTNKFGKRMLITLVYGSAAYKMNNEKSDIDFFIVCDAYNEQELDEVVNFVIELHKKYNIALDNEVPFSRKVLFSKSDFEDAIEGGGFIIKEGKFTLPPVVKNKEFLDSSRMGKRLVLNALTSPNILIGGDREYYRQSSKKAFTNLVKIIYSAFNLKNIELEGFIKLIMGKGKKSGENFLGYKNFRVVYDFLENNLRPYFNSF